jgi:predicted permease
MDLLNGLLISLVLALITHIFGFIVAYTILRGKTNPDITIERFSTIFSNCGFMGVPLVNGIYGSEGVFYITAYITVFNIILWTIGVVMMTNAKKDWKSLLKSLVSPVIVTIMIGIIFFIFQIRIPDNILQAMKYVGDMNTPLAMMIAGVAIGSSNILKLIRKFRIYLVAFLKLLVIPAILLLIYTRFPISDSVLTTAILASACPAASTGTLFALRYDKNAMYASEIFTVTTLLSAITIPLIMMMTEFLLK